MSKRVRVAASAAVLRPTGGVAVGAVAALAVHAVTVRSVSDAEAATVSTTTVVDPGAGGPSLVGVPVVFRHRRSDFLMIFRLSAKPARIGGSGVAGGSINGYGADAGGALSFLHENGRTHCYMVTFTGFPSKREGDDRWTFPGSRPRLDRRRRGDRVTVRVYGDGARPTLQDPEARIEGPTVSITGVKVHDPGRPKVDILGGPALDNREAQRVLKSIGCNGRIAAGLSRFIGTKDGVYPSGRRSVRRAA